MRCFNEKFYFKYRVSKVNGRTVPRRWFHRHPKLTLSVFMLFGCVVAIILAEITARMLFPKWAPAREERVKFWTYSEFLGWEHSPNQRGRFNHQDFSVDVVINSHGMRDDEYSMERTEKKRMLVLGDSFGWGFGIEHQERFSEILESTRSDWEIINASVSGYGTDQQFLYMKEKGIDFKPDVYLLLFYENDFENNIHAKEYWYFKPFFVVEGEHLKLQNVPVPKATMAQRLDRFFLGRTYLGPRLYFSLRRLKSLVNTMIKSRGVETREKDSVGEQTMYDVTYHLITAMNDLSRKEGAQFVPVSIPMNGEKMTWLQKIAEKGGIPYLQLDKYFESKGASVMFPHDAHWNANGHAIAANAIDEFLHELKLFGSSKSER